MTTPEQKRAELKKAALEYHEFPTPGKLAISATKQLTNQRDLALAYSPGVAAPCEEIVENPTTAFKYTSRGNLVAVITNGTAVLGLGDIGPLAAKPLLAHVLDTARALQAERIVRSEERRVGKECTSWCRSRWSPYH